MTDYAVEMMQAGDIDAVADIHAASFDDAWTAPMIRRILSMPGASGMVARSEDDGTVAGFSLSRVAADECELLSLGVADAHRRCGVGRMLLTAAMAWASAAHAERFFLEVAEDNDAALRLYAGHGLTPVGRRPNYYELKGGGYTAALTMRRLLQSVATPRRLNAVQTATRSCAPPDDEPRLPADRATESRGRAPSASRERSARAPHP